MKRHVILAAAVVAIAISTTSCSSAVNGGTPFFQDSNESSISGSPSSKSTSDVEESTDGSLSSTGDTNSNEASSMPSDEIFDGEESPALADGEDNPYGDSDINEPVILGQEDVPDKILSPEEMKEIEEGILDEVNAEEGAPSRVSDEHFRGANDSFNGVMSLVSERRYAEACEKYVYIPEGETMDSCAGKLQISYPNAPDVIPMTKENTSLVVWDKEYITATLKGKGRDESQQQGYFLVDGVWRGMFI